MISRHCLIEAELVEQRTLVVVLTPHHRPSPTQNIVRRRNQCSPKPSNHFCNKIGPKRTKVEFSSRRFVRFSNRPFGVKRFQAINHYLSDYPPLQCRCRSRARASLRNRHQGPFHYGIRERGGTI